MAYFVIIPVYLAFIIGLICVAVITQFTPRFRQAGPYIFGGAIGTLLGLVVFNLLIWAVGLFPVWLCNHILLPDWLTSVSKIFGAFTLSFGPLIGSAVGTLAGLAGGIYYVFTRKRYAAEPIP